jgi:hypothetical protein
MWGEGSFLGSHFHPIIEIFLGPFGCFWAIACFMGSIILIGHGLVLINQNLCPVCNVKMTHQ